MIQADIFTNSITLIASKDQISEISTLINDLDDAAQIIHYRLELSPLKGCPPKIWRDFNWFLLKSIRR